MLATTTIVAAVLATILRYRHLAFAQYDDSYITYRYAFHLGTGQGWVFNPGESVNSASSTLYTLALAPFATLGLDAIPVVGATIGFASFVTLLALLTWMAVASVTRLTTCVAALVPLVVVGFSAVNQLWVLSGMETLPFCLVLALALRQSTLPRIHTIGTLTILCLSLSGLALLRPEGQLLALAISLGASWRLWRGRSLAVAAVPPVVVIVIALAQGIWQVAVFGSLLGTPVAFKSISQYYAQSPIEALQQVPGYLLSGMSPSEGPWALAAVVLLTIFVLVVVRQAVRACGSGRLLIVLMPLTLGLIAFLLFASLAARSDYFRYLSPLSVFLAVGILVLLREIDASSLSHDERAPQVLGWAALAVVVVYIPAQLVAAQGLASDVNSRIYLQQARIEMGRWLESETPPATRVLAGDLGALAYFNPSNVYVDSVGLTNAVLTEGLVGDASYRTLIREAGPEWVVDTVGASGVIGSEATYDDPEGYYTLDLDRAEPGSFRLAWRPMLVKRLPPKVDETDAYIGAYILRP